MSGLGRGTTTLRERLFEAGLGPGGIRSLAVIGVLSVVRAVSLVLIAESLAGSVAAVASGGAGWHPVIALGVLGAVLRAGSAWAVATVAAHEAIAAKTGFRRDLLERVARGGADADGGSVAVLASTGLDDLDDYYGSVIPAAVSAVVVPLVLGLRILSVDWISALIVALTVPLVPLFLALIGMHTRARTDAASRALTRLTDHLVELAHGLPVLVGLGRVEEQTDALDGIQRELRRRTGLTLRTAFLSAFALELIATLSVALVAVTLGLRLLGGQLGLGSALLVLLLAPECFTAIREVGTAFHAAQDGTSALRRVRELLGGRPRLAARPRAGDVVVEDLTVQYAGRAVPAVAHLSAVFPRGRVTAVAGPSGAGKSTLLAALAGTLDADARVTGRLRGVDPDRLAVVPQAPRFFAATARGELELAAAPGSDVPRLLELLDLTAVADRARAELSPGEARRVAVARAMLRAEAGAAAILLDEPTAHLDEASAARVRDVIRRLARSAAVIVVSHDPAVLALADARVEVAATRPVVGVSGRALAADASPKLTDGSRRDPVDPVASVPTPGPRGLGIGVRTWLAAIALGTLATGLGLALTAVSAWLIVRAAEHPEIMYLTVAIVGVRFFGLGRSVARYAERLVTHRAVLAATDALRLRIWRSIAARGAGSRRLQEGGVAVDYLITSLDEVRELAPRVVVPIAVGALTIAGVTTTVALVDPAAVIPVGVALVALAVLAVLVSRRAERAAGAERIVARAELVERVVALADAATDLRANGMSRRALAVVDATSTRLAALDRRAVRSAGVGSAILSLGTALLAVLVPAQAGVSAETIAVVALLALACGEPLAELHRALQRVPALRAVLARLRPFLDARDPEPAPRSPETRLDTPVERLTLDDLAARWPGAARPVFRGLDAELARGERLVVEGPSGSGKTTLLTLLLGGLAPAEGRILVDGDGDRLRHDLARADAADWRRHVAWCPQEAHVFDSTIRGNLLLARPRTDPIGDAEMVDVLGRVGLGPLLARLPEGLDARVGTRGEALSGGERQRLAVARALLSRAELLLLDEPTAHLDAETAAAMMDDIRAATRDRLLVLVTHRAEDRDPADIVVTLGERAREKVDA